MAIGHRDIRTVDDAAKLLLSRFIDVDEQDSTFRVGFSRTIAFEFQSSTLRRYFSEGRQLEVLQDVLLKRAPEHADLLLLVIDEADKCPIPLARLFRVMVTQLQHAEVKNVRFIFAGVGTYLEDMLTEDPGVGRFLSRPLIVAPMTADEATELVESKLHMVANPEGSDEADRVEIHPDVVERIVALSGGHPHLIQFLGYHLVEQEVADPDGRLDAWDMANSFRKICYEDRAYVYDPLFARLQSEGMYEPLKALIDAGSPMPPTLITHDKASLVCGEDALEWLCANSVLINANDGLRLVDEFVRVRIIMDEQTGTHNLFEQRLAKFGEYLTDEEAYRDKRIDEEEQED